MKTISHPPILFLIILTLTVNVYSQQTVKINNFQEALALVKNKNYLIENANLQSKIASLTKQAAIGNVFNPRFPISFQAVDNLNLQVSFLPAEAFGGPAGTFREVAIGQQYISTLSFAPQFEIINVSNIAQVKSAKINEQLVNNQNKINEIQLYDKINAVYSNILSYQAQQTILKENLAVADTIYSIVKKKHEEGVLRKQDLNEASINVLNINDKLQQLEINLKIQYQLLHLFYENQFNSEIFEEIWSYENSVANIEPKNNLDVENTRLQLLLAKQEYNTLKYQNLPSLSFISAFNWQNLSNEFFFHTNSNTINYNYVGLRLNLDLPTAQRLANTKNKTIQIKMLNKLDEHGVKENEQKNLQMKLEHEKAIKQTENFKKISDLKKDTYQKNLNQFKENIMPLDKLLLSHNELLISRLNLVQALANISYTKHKIDIHNIF